MINVVSNATKVLTFGDTHKHLWKNTLMPIPKYGDCGVYSAQQLVPLQAQTPIIFF